MISNLEEMKGRRGGKNGEKKEGRGRKGGRGKAGRVALSRRTYF